MKGVRVANGRKICEIMWRQNQYNRAHSDDDVLIDSLVAGGIAHVPFFRLGGCPPFQSSAPSSVADQLGGTPLQMAQAWLLQRSPNILLVPGTSSVAHLRENLKVGVLQLPADALEALDGIASVSRS